MNEFQAPDRLTSALRRVAAEDDVLGASPAVEARLLAEVRAMARARRRRARLALLSAAAAVLVAAGLGARYWWNSTGTAGPPRTVTMDVAPEETTEFFPLPYSHVPAPDAHVVRLRVPSSALQTFGVASFVAGDVSTVLADVVVGDDGLARAVRFVRVAAVDEQQEQEP